MKRRRVLVAMIVVVVLGITAFVTFSWVSQEDRGIAPTEEQRQDTGAVPSKEHKADAQVFQSASPQRVDQPSESLSQGEKKAENKSSAMSLSRLGPKDLGIPYEKYVQLLAKSRRLGRIPQGDGPVTVERFSYVTLEKGLVTKESPMAKQIETLAQEATKQKLLVGAQPFFIVPLVAGDKIDNERFTVALPVVVTGKVSRPLLVQDANPSTVIAGALFKCEHPSEGLSQLRVLVERAKALGLKPKNEVWLRIETLNWMETPQERTDCRLILPVETP